MNQFLIGKIFGAWWELQNGPEEEKKTFGGWHLAGFYGSEQALAIAVE